VWYRIHETSGINKQLLKAIQLPKAVHARGVWGHAPQENFEF